MGRTQLQDAVPMTLGQEFEAFAETLAGEVRALEAIQRVLCEINMGGDGDRHRSQRARRLRREVRHAPGGDHRACRSISRPT